MKLDISSFCFTAVYWNARRFVNLETEITCVRILLPPFLHNLILEFILLTSIEQKSFRPTFFLVFLRAEFCHMSFKKFTS